MTRGHGTRVDGPRHVAKRDGRRALFEPQKIKSAVWRAMQAVGDGDEAFADDVAAVVALALRREASLAPDPDWTPTIEDVQDRVERALIEMGRAAVAKAYILYRDRRARARAAARPAHVAAPANHAPHATDAAQRPGAAGAASAIGAEPPPTERVLVRRADRVSTWSRGRIAAALVGEADLSRELADRVAARVEERVLASGLGEVSTALVRALVDHELVALGLVETLRRTEPIALPRHDLARITSGSGAEVWEPWRRSDVVVGGAPLGDGFVPAGAASAGDLGAVVAGEVLRRHGLVDVLDRRSAELHAAGDLHVEDLCRPHRYLHLSVPTDLLGGDAGLPADAAHAALGTLAQLLEATSRGLTVEDAGPLLRALLGAGEPLRPWLLALGAVARAAGQRVALRVDGPVHVAERAALVAELAAEDRGVDLPVAFVDVHDAAELIDGSPALRQALLGAADAGRLVVSWHAGEGRLCGPGALRGRGERGLLATAGAVAVNLPRLARRVGAGQEERLLEELYGLLSCATEAARSLVHFQERAGPGRRRSREALRLFARSSVALVPVGLAEALRILGDGEVDPVQGARVLGLMSEAAARFPEPGALRLELSSFFGAEAARRLAFSDRTAQDAPRSRQAWLFAEMSGQDALVRAYSTGFAVGPAANWRSGECEAELVRTVSSGFLHPCPASAAGPAPSVALERFVALRRAALGGARDPRGRDVFDGLAPRDVVLPLPRGRAAIAPNHVTPILAPSPIAPSPYAPSISPSTSPSRADR